MGAMTYSQRVLLAATHDALRRLVEEAHRASEHHSVDVVRDADEVLRRIGHALDDDGRRR